MRIERQVVASRAGSAAVLTQAGELFGRVASPLRSPIRAHPKTKRRTHFEGVPSIRTATLDDVSSLVALHTAGLPNEFLVRLGPRFLTKVLFAALYESPRAHIYVAEDSSGVLGFLVSRDRMDGVMGEIIGRHPIRFAATCIPRLLRRPSLLSDCLGILAQLRSRSAAREDHGTVELLLMAVAEHARRRGIGRALVQHAVAQFQARGITSCRVRYHRANAPIDALYRGLGYPKRRDYRFGRHWWRERDVRLNPATDYGATKNAVDSQPANAAPAFVR